MTGRRSKVWRGVGITASALVVLAVGACIGYALAFYLPEVEPIWAYVGDLFKSPAVAGLAALIAAVIAFKSQQRSAASSTSSARENALRKEWWDRTEWCLGQATSNDDLARSIGIQSLAVQYNNGTDAEAQMLRPIVERMTEEDERIRGENKEAKRKVASLPFRKLRRRNGSNGSSREEPRG